MTTQSIPWNHFRKIASRALRIPRRLRGLLAAKWRPHDFDLYDFKGLNSFLMQRGCRPLTVDPIEAELDVAGAMRWILGFLATNPRIRRRYPNALSSGLNGRFAQEVLSNAKLSQVARENIRKAFQSDPSTRLKRVFEFREDLREICPLALTPKGRGDFLSWLVTFGLKDFQHTPEMALWYQFEQDEDPSRGLVSTYRILPEWQRAVPHGLTRFGWQELKRWIVSKYEIDARWLRQAVLPQQFRPIEEVQLLAIRYPEVKQLMQQSPEQVVDYLKRHKVFAKLVDPAWMDGLRTDYKENLHCEPAVNVIGLFRYTSGLQQAVTGMVKSLNQNHVRTGLRDFPVLFLREPRDRQHYDAIELHDITIVNTGIDLSIREAYRKSGLYKRDGVYRVGVWWWELDTIPEHWHDRAEEIDEIWAPTQFIAGAMSKVFRKPVCTMNPGVSLPEFQSLGKSYFGLSADRWTFAFVFDMNSRMQRKNPLGLIEAFREAFRPTDPVELVIKVSPPESYYQDQWQLLRDAIERTPNVKLIDRVLTRGELLGLFDAIDCGVSLHRSEGFGLTCAEMMLLGKPVIATGYSGNLDFMNDHNSYLVDYDLIMIEEDIDPYPKGAFWANPKVDHAAELLRHVYESRTEAHAKGLRAKADLERQLSFASAGARMRERLLQIRKMLQR